MGGDKENNRGMIKTIAPCQSWKWVWNVSTHDCIFEAQEWQHWSTVGAKWGVTNINVCDKGKRGQAMNGQFSNSDHMIILIGPWSKNVEIMHQNFRSNSYSDNVIALKGNWVLAEFEMTACVLFHTPYHKHLYRWWLQASSLSNSIIINALDLTGQHLCH